MPQWIPLSRLARLVGKPRAVLQRMAQSGELATFDGQVDLEEALRLFPDVKFEDEAELRRVAEIKEQAAVKPPSRLELPDAGVLQERLLALGRDYAAARGKLMHYERVASWIGDRLAEAVEQGEASRAFADRFGDWLKRELSDPPDDLKRWEHFLARERIMRVMTAHVTVLPKKQVFEVIGDESLLEAGLRAGLAMPYGCSNGTCGDCKCRVASGDVARIRPHDYVLTAIEKRQGYTLACSYTAVGDVSLEVPLDGVADIPEQTITARVRAVEPLGGRRIALHLLTPRADRLRYLAGQWLEITVDGRSLRVPAAGCPCEERRVEVHIECEDPAADPNRPFSTLRPDAEVVIRGPYGDFVLDDNSERPVILIAEGAGFAQVRSILQHALSLERAPAVELFRLANAEGLYQENLLKSYAGALDNFRYIAFSHDQGADALIGELTQTVPNLAAFDVYAAGRSAFVSAVQAHCRAAGVPDDRCKAEAID